MTTVVGDEVVDAVEGFLLNQVVPGLAIFLLCTYSTVIDGRLRSICSPAATFCTEKKYISTAVNRHK